MLIALTASVLLAGSLIQEPDQDSDGLPDAWETAGSGPIQPRIHGCRPDRADFFFVAVRRPGLTMAAVMPELEKAKRFFARLPNRNPDGSTGINMIIVDGGEIPLSELNTPYTELFATRMPEQWKGKGHGYMLEPGRISGGGNTINGIWSGSSSNWAVVVHELGHQFGLGHEAPGSRPGPVYTSLMNYAYSYSFMGSIDNIHFSTGKFLSTPLTETSLNEVMPYSLSDLAHFGEPPYEFKMRRKSDRETEIDFNRNGIFGERNVRASISDGYAVITEGAVHLGPASGAPTMAVVRDAVYTIWPVATGDQSTWTKTYAETGQSLRYARKSGNVFAAEAMLVPGSSVKGSPSAAEFKDRLAVGYLTTSRLPMVTVWATTRTGLGRRVSAVAPLGTVGDHVTLASYQSPTSSTMDQCWMLVWNKDTKRTKVYEVLDSGGETAPVVRLSEPRELDFVSDTPVAAVYNRKLSRLVVAGTARWNTQENSIQLTDFRFDEARGWTRTGQRWVGLISDRIVTGVAPAMLIDDGPTGGEKGLLRIYFRPITRLDDPSTIFRAMEIVDTSSRGGWRTKMMRDEWSASRSAAAAVDYRGETMFALRWFGEDLDNRMVILNKASGLSDVPIRDFNDVEHIATKGLKESLTRY